MEIKGHCYADWRSLKVPWLILGVEVSFSLGKQHWKIEADPYPNHQAYGGKGMSVVIYK